MAKKTTLIFKALSFMLAVIMLFNLSGVAVGALADEISQLLASTEVNNTPTVDEIKIPTTNKNPNNVNVSVQAYPVYRSDVLESMRRRGGQLTSYALFYGGRTSTRSQYYTASLLVWDDYYDFNRDTDLVESSLPYREERTTMVHPELVFTSGYWIAHIGNTELDPFSDYGKSLLDLSQVKLQAGATLISGKADFNVYHYYSVPAPKYSEMERFSDTTYTNEAVAAGTKGTLRVEVPLKNNSTSVDIRFGTAGTITDVYAALVDDTAPNVTDVKLRQEKKTGDVADLVMDMTFNEGVRFAAESVANQLNDIWVEVELRDLESGEAQKAKLYIEAVNGKTVTFRGSIGKYHYRNYKVEKITRVSLPKSSISNFGFIDLVDGMYVSAYDIKEYNNGLVVGNVGTSYFSTTAVCDLAGNAINLDTVRNWSFGENGFVSISNTFEIVKLEVHNEKTLNNTSDEPPASDLYAGPARPITVYAYLDTELSEEEWKKVGIKLNIKDSETGEYLTAYPTSAQPYSLNELYDGDLYGTVLIFEDIALDEGMEIDLNSENEPVIQVTEMFDEIDGKTAYPYITVKPNDMYADLVGPVATVTKYYERLHEPDESDSQKYYTVSIELTVEDVAELSRFSGISGLDASGSINSAIFSIGGGVDKDTQVLYVISENPEAPKAREEYTDSIIISPNGIKSLRPFATAAETTTKYLHLRFDSDGLYVDDLFFDVEVSDLVGNKVSRVEEKTVEYLIDEIPPDIRFDSTIYTAVDENTSINLTVNMSATDKNQVTELLYCFASDPYADGAEWQVAVIKEFGTDVCATIEKKYGGFDVDANRVYSEILWIKAIDEFGNESKPVSRNINVSTQKPATTASLITNPNEVSRYHQLLVSGPDKHLGMDAYTRVTLTPIENSEYSYVTLIKTGDKDVNVLSFEGLTWYRVRLGYNTYEEVSQGVVLESGFKLTEDHLLYGLLTYYGELKISFENGYANMTPALGAVYSMASAGSYFADPNYFTVRFASPYDTEKQIHSVDFGQIIDREDTVLLENADKGAEAIRINQTRKGISPMRNMQIHFTISNIANSSYGLLDLDYENSFAELVKVGEDGAQDTVVASQMGLWASGSQYFTVKNEMDNGEYFTTGAYYLRVTVLSKGENRDVYESSRIVLDAQTADNAGVWQYSYQTMADLSSVGSYSWLDYEAENEPYKNIGVSVVNGGETMRSSLFAVYTYGVTGLNVCLQTPGSLKSYEGIEVGRLEGFKMWNSLSAPTASEIEAQGFLLYRTSTPNTSVYSADLDDIYTADSIPKGADSFGDLYLVKGVNTLCYQYKMENGYVSPIRYFTVMVTDNSPELNIAIDSYQPSHEASQIDGVVNADHIRFFVETAYSLNGTGKVNVELWSDYGMNLGLYDENGELVDTFLEDPSKNYNGVLSVIKSNMAVGEYADFAQNSYTSKFPTYSELCSAVFVARDEYGGVTFVAPQIGDHIRYGTSGGEAYYNVYNIDYLGGYFDDPYVVGDSFTKYRIYYNQPVYFGKQLLYFETYLIENTSDGEVRIEDITKSDPTLQYNLFNILTNDIELGLSEEYGGVGESYSVIFIDNIVNHDLINMQSATITFEGGDLTEPVTLTFADGMVVSEDEDGASQRNTIGYTGGRLTEDEVKFIVANPRASEANPAGTAVTRSYTISYSNLYGDSYTRSGTITLEYIDYKITGVKMTNSGAELSYSFESTASKRTGVFNNGKYTVSVLDYYGNTVDYSYEVTDARDASTVISYEKFTKTAQPVKVSLNSKDGYAIYVDITDYAAMSVEGSGTSSVTVTVYENTEFSYRYLDKNGKEMMYFVNVDNIRKPDPQPVWSYDSEDVNTREDGTRYRYGEVTVYLTDTEFTLTDKQSGLIPSFTFVPGGSNTYTFKKEELKAVLGDEEVELENDITVVLDLVLYEVPNPIESTEDDQETPNVQIRAYSNLNGIYSDKKLSMKLTNARNSNALTSYSGYTVYEYLGSRANMAELLEEMGWSTSYRFVLETVDMSKTRLFIKEGLYAEAPDFETGVSDIIDGVELNSKLLTVGKNAKFSLFVVDENNNASSIAFDVTDLGDAPSPSVVKVPLDNGKIRAYILPPEGSENFKILTEIQVGVENDDSSKYYLKNYIDFGDNDDYSILYSLEYNGVTVQSVLDLSVTEISLREISVVDGGIVWSANKASEATPNEVTAEIMFTEPVKELRALTAYDTDIVSFTVNGNVVRVTYKDNHSAIEFSAIADNGSYVTVRLDSVSNIDKSAPEIEEVSRVLAPNGKTLTLTLSTNERTTFKEGGGYVGEEKTDENGATKYYYTRLITENGEYTYTFTDMSGIQSSIEITVNELVLEELSVLYSLDPSGADAKDNASQLEVMTGDSVFINPSRDVTLEISSGTTAELVAGEWTSVEIPEAVGGIHPYFIMTDAYGNVLTHQLSKVEVPDINPPSLMLKMTTYYVREGTDRKAVEEELLANAVAFDDADGEISYTVEFTEDLNTRGISDVKYTAKDVSGNEAVMYGKLFVTSKYEPVIYIGEKRAVRDGGISVTQGEEIKLTIDSMGVNYKLLFEEGKKTSAQMKDGEILKDYSTDSEISIGALKSGIYTLCILTEQRDYFKFIIVVEPDYTAMTAE